MTDLPNGVTNRKGVTFDPQAQVKEFNKDSITCHLYPAKPQQTKSTFTSAKERSHCFSSFWTVVKNCFSRIYNLFSKCIPFLPKRKGAAKAVDLVTNTRDTVRSDSIKDFKKLHESMTPPASPLSEEEQAKVKLENEKRMQDIANNWNLAIGQDPIPTPLPQNTGSTWTQESIEKDIEAKVQKMKSDPEYVRDPEAYVLRVMAERDNGNSNYMHWRWAVNRLQKEHNIL